MTSKIIANGILRALGIILGIFLLLYFLYAIQSVIVFVIVAAILSLIGRPLIIFLRRKLKFPNILAVIATMVFMLSILAGVITLFIPLVVEQGKSLSLLQIDDLERNLEGVLQEITIYFSTRGIDVLKLVKNLDITNQFKEIPGLLNNLLEILGSFSVALFSILFITFFFMKDSQLLKQGILTLSPRKSEKRFANSLEVINDLLSRYFIGLILQISILFIIYTIILLSFSISNPIVIAFLCALLNLIPYVGPLIGACVMFILSMTSNIGLDFQTEILPTSLWIMFFYGLAQLLDNFVSQPLIFSKSAKSHPLEIFLVIIIGGLLFGIAGMITAVPSYTVIKVISKEFWSEYKIVKSLTKNI